MPSDTPIIPRKVDLGFPAPVPRHWAGDPLLTRIADSLSLLFPAGEQFFIRSVQNYRNDITDPVLRQQVRDFAYQEAQHSNAHEAYNDMLLAQGLKLGWVGPSLERRFGFARKYFPTIQQLALTVTAEHLTATMAESLLTSMRDHFQGADPRMRALYYWHAVEEVEHKAVAWDVYEQVAKGSWLRRALSQAWTTFMVTINVAPVVAYMLYKDGLLFDLGMWRNGLRTLWGRGGFFRRMVRPYLQGFKPGFHPRQTERPHGFDEFIAAWHDAPGDALGATEHALAALA